MQRPESQVLLNDSNFDVVFQDSWNHWRFGLWPQSFCSVFYLFLSYSRSLTLCRLLSIWNFLKYLKKLFLIIIIQGRLCPICAFSIIRYRLTGSLCLFEWFNVRKVMNLLIIRCNILQRDHILPHLSQRPLYVRFIMRLRSHFKCIL